MITYDITLVGALHLGALDMFVERKSRDLRINLWGCPINKDEEDQLAHSNMERRFLPLIM